MGTANPYLTDSDTAESLLERLRYATAGTYDVAGVLGNGGMAVVFVGEDMRLGRKVAIKVMDPRLATYAGMAERFTEEARTLAKLRHPNIIVVYDVKQERGLNFFVMDLVEGGGVELLTRRPEVLPIEQAQWILLHASRALAHAHAKKIVHRDVKPHNILLNVDGDAILTDFGIAKVTDSTNGLTKSGTQIGTPVYMSPEQFSEGPVGAASDQYALGVTAYELLTGAPPFKGELYALIAAHGNKQPTPIRQLRPDCPAFLANAVMRMLEKNPEDRWPSMDDVAEIFGANLPNDGGNARRQLALVAQELQRQREAESAGLTAVPPNTPEPPTRPRPDHIVTVWPPAATIFVGGTLDLQVTANTPNGEPLAHAGAVWSSSDPTIAVVDAQGRVRGVGYGSVAIRAVVQEVAAEAQLTVDLAPIARLAVAQRSPSVYMGEEIEPEVVAYDLTGQARPDVSLSWLSRTTGVAELVQPGRLRAVSPGRAAIEVSFGNLRQSIELTVLQRPVTRVSIQNAPRRVELGDRIRLTVLAFDDRGTPVTPDGIHWSTTNRGVVQVDSAGTVLAIGEGRASVQVSVGSATDSVEIEAIEPPIASLALDVPQDVMEVGDTSDIKLKVLDASGALRSDAGTRVWCSAPAIVALDTGTMTLRALAEGSATVTAEVIGGASGVASVSRTITVVPKAVARLEVLPPSLDLELHAMQSLSVQAFDRAGQRLPGARVTWRSSDATCVTVTDSGTVRAIAPGRAELIAASGIGTRSPVEVRVPVTVLAPPAPEVEPAPVPVREAPAATSPDAEQNVRGTPASVPVVDTATPSSVPTVERDEGRNALIGGGGVTDVFDVTEPPVAAPPRVPPVPVDVPRQPVATPSGGPVTPPRTETPPVTDAVASQPQPRAGNPRLAMIAGGIAIAVIGGYVALKPKAVVPVDPAPPAGVSGDTTVRSDTTPADVGNGGGATLGNSGEQNPTQNPTDGGKQPGTTGETPRKSPRDSATTKKNPNAVVVVDDGGGSAQPLTVQKGPTVPPGPGTINPGPTQIAVKPGAATGPLRVPDPPPEPEAPAAFTADDARPEVERIVAGIRSGSDRPGALASFFADGAEHAVSLVGAPVVDDRGHVQFELRLKKVDFSSIPITRATTVTMELVRRGGRVSSTSVTVSPLRKGK